MIMGNHIKSDGNGKLLVSKPLALISLIIAILAVLIPAVFAYGVLNERVDYLETTITQGIPHQEKVIADMKEDIEHNGKSNAVIEAKIDRLLQDIQEIKKDIKELR